MLLSYQPGSLWDEKTWGTDTALRGSLYKIEPNWTSYGSFSSGDYKDYYEIAPGVGSFKLVVTSDPSNGFLKTSLANAFDLKITDEFGGTVFSADAVGPDVYTDSITFRSGIDTYWVEITNSQLGDFSYAAALIRQNTSLPAVTLSPTTPSITEGDTGSQLLTFTATLSAASSSAVSVSYSTADGTATANSDYMPSSGTLTFAAGQTSKTFSVSILGDTVYEPNETFMVSLTNPSGATLGSVASTTATILNNDPAPTGDKGLANKDLVFVFKSEKTGADVNPASYSYFYTANSDEASYVRAQANWPWVEKTATFEAAHSNPLDAVPVFRFWSDKYQSHFFTINTAEKAQIIDWSSTGTNGYDWKYEGENFKVYTSPTPTDASGKAAIPVYRIWMDDKDFNPANGLVGGHFFTADKTAYDSMVKLVGVVDEGVAFYGEVPGA